ncbi:YbaB/EbfC family nucleoid-associated protein [Eggerthellaceae bacterium zg-1084]|uniref:Nucleoid-associated protein HLV38_06490 n=1 Tax=Berryella wangjianweii TaxID=2734634 RepID=A0A6M8IY46_9ACTN|nr:YbaB/EbfC family nucleoid-associated protein [Berryella wangjianweii]NPD31583.1 YbaB/EbfC family nucleoid-associated protein [Berryella wangjianweii]NPD32922.1 YbaB/EbfC family nucleoid-associated protein [Eggerthellaceae bacterium zg-997]QKF07795.1 YbaB/EbfC family nucleoid-associated protein [Berryella wangjianweii]
MDMKKMMKQAQMMQLELARAQEEIKTMTFSATAGGGMVEAVAKGDNTLESLTINPDALSMADADMLQDMVLAAVNEALRGVASLTEQRLSSVTGGMKLPGM